jgi:aspartate aminotransferase-like enzyme
MLVAEEKNRSNAVTAIVTDKNNATEICEVLKDRFAIWVCPNGGEYRDRVFRVGHIGAIDCDEYKILFDALYTLSSEGIL